MIASRIAGALIAAGALVVALSTSVADAQSAQSSVPCVIAQRALTTDEQSMVNDYEVQVAKANSKHTPVPAMPDTVFALIGCESPASQTSQAESSSAATTSSSSMSSTTTTTFTCPANGLSKDQESMINDFEILVARANSKHTPVPTPSTDVAALIACQ